MQDAQSFTEKCSKGSTVAAGEWRALLPLQKRGPRPDCVKAFIPVNLVQDAQSITEKCSKGSTVAAGEWRALLPLQKRGPRPDCVKAFIPITKARDHQAGLRGTAERNHTL